MRSYILLFLFITVGVYSQDVELRWSEKVKTKGTIVSILGGRNGKYFTKYIDRDSELICRAYNSEMKMEQEKKISFNIEAGKRYGYLDGFFLKDKIIHFIVENKRKEDRNLLLSATTGLDLNTSDKTFVLDEAEQEDKYLGTRNISPDSTKVLVYHEKKVKKNEGIVMSFKVYNSDLTDNLLDKEAEIPIRSKKFESQQVAVDNFGNVYVLAKVFKEKSEKEKEGSQYYFKLIVFNKSNEPKEFDFDYPGKDIATMDILPGKDNTLICAGFLTPLEKAFAAKKALVSDELFAVSIDSKTLTIKNSKKVVIDGLYPKKGGSKKDYIPYKIRDIFFKEDGGAIVVAEQYMLIVTSTKNGTSYTYYYGDVVCVNLDKNTEVVSVGRIAKYQKNASNPSIISTYTNGKTFIVYEDVIKNLNVTDDNKIKKTSKGDALYIATIDADGSMKKDVLFPYKSTKIGQIDIKSGRVVDKNNIMIPATYQIGLLSIKK